MLIQHHVVFEKQILEIKKKMCTESKIRATFSLNVFKPLIVVIWIINLIGTLTHGMQINVNDLKQDKRNESKQIQKNRKKINKIKTEYRLVSKKN